MIGSTIGPYSLDRELGSGGMGAVFLATVDGDAPGLAKGTKVAVKVVHPHLLATPGFFKRFLREAEIGKAVRHENVVRTFDVDATLVDGKQANYLVMEYVEGKTLREMLGDLRTVPEALLRELVSQIAAGLAAIHAAGIVHRDLKPENVLVTKDHQVRIMDLGVARLQEATVAITKEGQFAGSLLYASPEQFKRDAVGPASDLYSLGVMVYELASGSNPFARDTAAQVISAHLNETPRALRDVASEVSAFLGELAAALLSKDPKGRFGSATELRAVLADGESSAWWAAREKTVRESESRLPSIQVRRDTELFGRDDELGLLRSLYERARTGEGQVAFVEGEAGIGKTRLVDAFLRSIDAGDVHVLYGAYTPTRGFGGLSDAVTGRFGVANLADALRPHLAETPGVVASFAAMLRHDAPPTGVDALADDAVSAVFCRLLASLAADRPTIWIVDELHYAPDESRRVVLAMARALASWRVLLVVAARPGIPDEEIGHFARIEHLRRVPLRRLSPREVVQLLRDAFKSELLAERLVGKIAFKSDGVPFFVLEILRGLREGQFIKRLADGTYVETQVVSDIEVPSAVRGLVEARLGGLVKEERAILDVAAVTAYEFDPDLVARVLETKRIVVLQTLADLERRSGVVRAAGRAFRFDHHQIQEVLYQGLAPALREEYHAMLADAFAERERVVGKEPADVPGEAAYFLAWHGLGGSRPESALVFLPRAFAHLDDSVRHGTAVDLADRALAVDGLLQGDARLEMLLRKIRHQSTARGHAELRPVIDQAIALAEASRIPSLRVRTYLADGACRRSFGDLAGHLAAARRAETEAGGDARLAASSLEAAAQAQIDLGDWGDARRTYDRALVLAVEGGDATSIATCLGRISFLCFLQGEFDEALDIAERALAGAGPGRGRSGELNVRAIAFQMLGRWTEALRDYRTAYEECRAQGLPGSIFASNLGLLYGALGDPERCREMAQESLSGARIRGDRTTEAYTLHEVGCEAARAGRIDEATSALSTALALRREIRYPRGIAETLLALGRLELERGDHAAARGRLAEGARIAAEIRSRERVLCPAWLACVPGEDVEGARRILDEHGGRLSVRDGMEAQFALWRASGDRALLVEAKRRLDHIVEHAPDEYKTSMVERVPLHRDIAAAARKAGL